MQMIIEAKIKRYLKAMEGTMWTDSKTEVMLKYLEELEENHSEEIGYTNLENGY